MSSAHAKGLYKEGTVDCQYLITSSPESCWWLTFYGGDSLNGYDEWVSRLKSGGNGDSFSRLDEIHLLKLVVPLPLLLNTDNIEDL